MKRTKEETDRIIRQLHTAGMTQAGIARSLLLKRSRIRAALKRR